MSVLCLQGARRSRGTDGRTDGAICVISQRAPLNPGLIKQWQYGPDMKEPSLKKKGPIVRAEIARLIVGRAPRWEAQKPPDAAFR